MSHVVLFCCVSSPLLQFAVTRLAERYSSDRGYTRQTQSHYYALAIMDQQMASEDDDIQGLHEMHSTIASNLSSLTIKKHPLNP